MTTPRQAAASTRPRRSRSGRPRSWRSTSAGCSAISLRSSRSTPQDSLVPIDRDAVDGGVRVRLRAPRRSAPAARARSSSSIRSGSRGSAPACAWTPRRSARRCCTTPSRTPRHRSRRSRSGSARTSPSLVDGVTKLTGITFSSRDEAQAENYRKMIVAMATRRAGHPDQARRSPAQHADDRCDAEAEADREVAGDARDLRADRPSARHPRDQVGARGSRLPDASPAQVQRDQGARRAAARRPRALRQPGRRDLAARARLARHRRRRSPAARSTSTRSTRR